MKTKTIVCLLSLLAVGACRSQKNMTEPMTSEPMDRSVDVTVHETIRDTITLNMSNPGEPRENVRQEEVKPTRGEIKHYCVIVGSFDYERNAVKLCDQLVRNGFAHASIMRNKQGMYRVSCMCDDNRMVAETQLRTIRGQGSRFADAWLLEVK